MQNEKIQTFITAMLPALAAVIVGSMVVKKLAKRR